MKIKKKSLLMASACLPLIMTAQKAYADNRIQYSGQDANALATDGNTNTMSYTFSHTGRRGNVLTAKDAYSASEKNHGGAGAATGGLWGTGEKPDWWDGITNPDGSVKWKDTTSGYCYSKWSSCGNEGTEACLDFCSNAFNDFSNAGSGDYWERTDLQGQLNSLGYDNSEGTFFGDYEFYYGDPSWIKGSVNDGKCSCENGICFTGDMPVTLANGSTKRADEITYNDELLVWDFDEGKFATAKPLWIKIEQTAQEYNYLRFSDGSILKTISQHRIFNQEAGKFTYPMTDETPLGTHTLNSQGEIVTLVEKKVVKEEVKYYNIITEHHLNCFAGGVLTSCRLNNIYPIKDMKFVKDNRKITPYEQFAELDRKWYDGLRLGEQQGEINKDGAVDHGDTSLVDYVKRIMKIMVENENESLFAKAC